MSSYFECINKNCLNDVYFKAQSKYSCQEHKTELETICQRTSKKLCLICIKKQIKPCIGRNRGYLCDTHYKKGAYNEEEENQDFILHKTIVNIIVKLFEKSEDINDSVPLDIAISEISGEVREELNIFDPEEKKKLERKIQNILSLKFKIQKSTILLCKHQMKEEEEILQQIRNLIEPDSQNIISLNRIAEKIQKNITETKRNKILNILRNEQDFKVIFHNQNYYIHAKWKKQEIILSDADIIQKIDETLFHVQNSSVSFNFFAKKVSSSTTNWAHIKSLLEERNFIVTKKENSNNYIIHNAEYRKRHYDYLTKALKQISIRRKGSKVLLRSFVQQMLEKLPDGVSVDLIEQTISQWYQIDSDRKFVLNCDWKSNSIKNSNSTHNNIEDLLFEIVEYKQGKSLNLNTIITNIRKKYDISSSLIRKIVSKHFEVILNYHSRNYIVRNCCLKE